MDSPPHIPSDILPEILARTSLETIARCRAVQKEWNLLTYDSNFLNLHCSRTSDVSGFLIQHVRACKHSEVFVSPHRKPDSDISLKFLPHPVKIEAVDQGLLYCTGENPDHRKMPRCYVCKPSIKQWRPIPNPKTRYDSERSAMKVLRSDPLHFKIVRFSKPKGSTQLRKKDGLSHCWHCEIFDSEAWSWKRKKDVELPHGVVFGSEPGIESNGAIHWMSSGHVFAYQVEQESFECFPIPQELSYQVFRDYELTAYEGKLAISQMKKDEFVKLWTIDNYLNKEWRLRQTWGVEGMDSDFGLEGFYCSNVGLMRGFSRMIFHNFENSNNHIVELEDLLFKKNVYLFQTDSNRTPLLEKEEMGKERDRRRGRSMNRCKKKPYR